MNETSKQEGTCHLWDHFQVTPVGYGRYLCKLSILRATSKDLINIIELLSIVPRNRHNHITVEDGCCKRTTRDKKQSKRIAASFSNRVIFN